MKKKSLLIRLSAIVLTIVIIPTILYFSYFISNAKKTSIDNFYTYNKSILNGINSRIEDHIKTLDNYADLLIDKNLLDEENIVFGNEEEKIKYIYSQLEEFESIMVYNSALNSLHIINESGYGSYENAQDIENQSWYRNIWANLSNYNILPQHRHVNYDSRYNMNRDLTVYSYVKKFNIENNERIVVVLNGKNYVLRSICYESIDNRDEIVQMYNKYGEIIYSNEKDFSIYDREYIYQKAISSKANSGKFSFIGKKDNKEKTVVYVKSVQNGNIYLKCIDNEMLYKDINDYIKKVTVVLCTSLFIIGFISILLIKWFLRPLMDLENGINKFADGKFDTILEIKRFDEIGQIANSFNIMAKKIRSLIHDKYELEIYNRNARYYSLVAQINPHFINNVLQCIGAMGLDKGVYEVYDSTTILAKMLRYSIKENDIVTVKKEIENVIDYVNIQKIRFDNKIEYNINYDENVLNFNIPKLTIQPLVENAVIHGFEKKLGNGKIDVTVKKIKNKLQITVKDNGLGISDDKLLQLKEAVVSKSLDINRKHIGVANVCKRLEIMHKDKFEVNISSKIGIGTKIVLEIGIDDTYV